MRLITLHHESLPDIEVPESSVRLHERSGWSRKAPAAQKAAPAVKKASTPVAATPTTTNGPSAGEES